MAKVSLKYGAQLLALELQARVLKPTAHPVPPDASEEIRRALAAPLGSPHLAELVRAGERVVIVTSDITRYTGSELYLPILVE